MKFPELMVFTEGDGMITVTKANNTPKVWRCRLTLD
jgi:hypothetical protein